MIFNMKIKSFTAILLTKYIKFIIILLLNSKFIIELIIRCFIFYSVFLLLIMKKIIS